MKFSREMARGRPIRAPQKRESLLRGASLKRPFAKLAGWFPLAVNVSSFLLFSWLPLVKSSVNDFPLAKAGQQFAGPLKASKLTLLVEASALLLQDIGAGLMVMSIKFFCGRQKLCTGVSGDS